MKAYFNQLPVALKKGFAPTCPVGMASRPFSVLFALLPVCAGLVFSTVSTAQAPSSGSLIDIEAVTPVVNEGEKAVFRVRRASTATMLTVKVSVTPEGAGEEENAPTVPIVAPSFPDARLPGLPSTGNSPVIGVLPKSMTFPVGVATTRLEIRTLVQDRDWHTHTRVRVEVEVGAPDAVPPTRRSTSVLVRDNDWSFMDIGLVDREYSVREDAGMVKVEWRIRTREDRQPHGNARVSISSFIEEENSPFWASPGPGSPADYVEGSTRKVGFVPDDFERVRENGGWIWKLEKTFPIVIHDDTGEPRADREELDERFGITIERLPGIPPGLSCVGAECDSGLVSSVVVTIVDDDHAPVITSTTRFTAPVGFTGVFAALEAEDADGDTLRWTITGGADADKFDLDEATGALSFNSDTYGLSEYVLEVEVSDGDNPVSMQVVVTTIDAALVPVVSVEADAVRVTEGSTAVFTLRRMSGNVGEALTVGVSVSTRVAEVDAPAGSPGVRFGGFPGEVSFDSGETTARLLILSEDDEVWQAHTSVTVTVGFGAGYVVSPDASFATVLVEDDELPDRMRVGFRGTNNFFNRYLRVSEGEGKVSVRMFARTRDARRPHHPVAVIAFTAVHGQFFSRYEYFADDSGEDRDFVYTSRRGNLFLPSDFVLSDGVWRAETFMEVEILDDGRVEPDEVLGLSIHALNDGESDRKIIESRFGGAVLILNDDHAPVITEAGPFRATARSTLVFAELRAEDADDDTLRWTITGGADADKFDLDGETGALSFNRDTYGLTDSADGDEGYELSVEVSDGDNRASTRVSVFVRGPASMSIKAVEERITEGGVAVFVLRRSFGVLDEALTVGVSVSTRVAEAGVPADSPGVSLGAFPGEATFGPGKMTTRFEIQTVRDGRWQAHTMMRVRLKFGMDYEASPGASSAVVLVLDDDVPAMTVGVSSTRMTVSEGEETLAVQVIARTMGAERPHTDVGIGSIRLSAVDGTALMPADYVADVMEMTIAPSNFTRVDSGVYEAALPFAVEIVDDAVQELEEEFVLSLTGLGLASAVSIEPSSAAVVIADDDKAVISVVADVPRARVVEGSVAAFTVRRDNDDVGEALLVPLGVSTETAETHAPANSPGVAFGAFPGEATLGPGQMTTRLEIPTVEDNRWQAHTTVRVVVLPGSGYEPSATMGSATVFVQDDDLPEGMVLGFSGTDVSGPEDTFVMVREDARRVPVVVFARTRDGRRPHSPIRFFVSTGNFRMLDNVHFASSWPPNVQDYQPFGVYAEFEAAEFSFDGSWGAEKRIGHISILDDGKVEPDEAFSLTLVLLSDLKDASVVAGGILILNDDHAPVITEAGPFRATARSTLVFAELRAEDADDDTLRWTITGGADDDKFDLDKETGALSFNSDKYGLTDSADDDENYELSVAVSDGDNRASTRVSVFVRDLASVSVEADAAGITEGSAAVFTLKRVGGDVDRALSVSVSVSAQVAEVVAPVGSPGVSFAPFPTQVGFGAWASTARLEITSLGDEDWQAHTSLTVTVLDRANYSPSATMSSAVVLVLDDDVPAMTVGVSSTRMTVSEGEETLAVQVIARTMGAEHPHTDVGIGSIRLSAVDGTALMPADYVADVMEMTIAPSNFTRVDSGVYEAALPFAVEIVDDAVQELEEEFVLSLTGLGLASAVSIEPSSAAVVIADDDKAVISVVADVPRARVVEGSVAAFTLRRDNDDVGEALLVPLGVSTETAETHAPANSPGVAFGAFPGEATLGPGQMTTRLEISTVEDNQWQAHMTVRVVVLPGSGYEPSATMGSATVFVQDDDLPEGMVLGFSGTDISGPEDTFVRVREDARRVPVVVFARTRDGRRPHSPIRFFVSTRNFWMLDNVHFASSWPPNVQDYQPFGVSAEFEEAEFRFDGSWGAEKRMRGRVRILDDGKVEPDEAFSLTLELLSDLKDASVVAGGILILNDDHAPVITEAGPFRATVRSTVVFAELRAVDADDDVLRWTITGGADRDKFDLDEETGALSFNSDTYGLTDSADDDENYELSVAVSDGDNRASTRVSVFVRDLASVSVEADAAGITEGSAAVFTLKRVGGDVDRALSVSVSVSAQVAEVVAPVGSPGVSFAPFPTQVGFGAWASTARLEITSLGDEDWQAHTSLTVTVLDSANYSPSATMSSAVVLVLDDDLPDDISVTLGDRFTSRAADAYDLTRSVPGYVVEDVGALEVPVLVQAGLPPHGNQALEFHLDTAQVMDYPAVNGNRRDTRSGVNADAGDYFLSSTRGGAAATTVTVMFHPSDFRLGPGGDQWVATRAAFLHIVDDAVYEAEEIFYLRLFETPGTDVTDAPRAVSGAREDLAGWLEIVDNDDPPGRAGELRLVRLTSRYGNLDDIDDNLQIDPVPGTALDLSSAPPPVPGGTLPGQGVFFGAVEVYRDGQWRGVCSRGWDPSDAGVVCRQLGIPGIPVSAATPGDLNYFIHLENVNKGRVRTPDPFGFWMGEVACMGDESSLAECRRRDFGFTEAHGCDSRNYAGVVCTYALVDTVSIFRDAPLEAVEGSGFLFTVSRDTAVGRVRVTVVASPSEIVAATSRFTVVFEHGSLSQRVSVATEDDERYEPLRTTLTVTLVEAVELLEDGMVKSDGARISADHGTAMAVVIDDDIPRGQLQLSPPGIRSSTNREIHIDERPTTTGMFDVLVAHEGPFHDHRLSGDTCYDVVVTSSEGTAKAGSDFEPLEETLRICGDAEFLGVNDAANRFDIEKNDVIDASSAYVYRLKGSFTVVDDTFKEPEQYFDIEISPAVASSAIVTAAPSYSRLRVTIFDTDVVESLVSVAADVVELIEGLTAVFTLRRDSDDLSEALTVMVGVSTETAEVEAPPGSPGVSFGGFPGEAIFKSGATTARLTISTTGDENWQAHTLVKVTVLPGAGYTPSETMSSAVVLVRDDDLPSIAVGFSDPGVTVEEGVGTLSVEVVARTAGNERPHTDVEIGGIRLSAMDGTAMAPSDYVFDPVSVSLSPPSFTRVDAGAYELALSFVVEIVDDEVAELEDEFDLTLTGVGLARAVSVDPSLATVVITDDDEKNLPREFAALEILDGDRVISAGVAREDSPYRVTEGSSVRFRLRRVGGFERTTATWSAIVSLGRTGEAIQAEEDAPESSTLVRWVYPGPHTFVPSELARGRTGRIVGEGTIRVPDDDEWGAHALLDVVVIAKYDDVDGLDPGDSEGDVPPLGGWVGFYALLLDNDQPDGMVGNLRRTDGSVFDAGTDDLRSLTLVREDAGEARSIIRIRTTDKRRPHGEVGKITYASIPLAGSAAPGTRPAEENKDFVRISEDVGFEESDFRLRRVGGKEIWEAVKPVVVPITDDEEVEPPEVFSGTLERTAGLSDKLVLGSVNVQFLILDDDELDVEVSLDTDTARVREGSPAVFTLMRDTTVSTLDVDVMVSTQVAEIEAPEGSPGVVFEPFPVSVRFEDGEATTRLEITSPGDEDWQAHTSLTVTVVPNLYKLRQPDRSGGMVFTNLATGYKVSPTMGSAVVLVEDDDLPDTGVFIGFRDTHIHDRRGEGITPREDSGEVLVWARARTQDGRRPHQGIRTRLSTGSLGSIVMDLEEEAVAGVDYVGINVPINQANMVFSESDFRLMDGVWIGDSNVAIEILDDELAEGDERFYLALERSLGLSDLVTLVSGAVDGYVRIIDDDHAPMITEAGPFRVPAGFTGVFGVLEAEDADGDSLEWSKSGGADSPVFTLDEATGELSFNSDMYGLTDSADGDAEYQLFVKVSDRYNQASAEVMVFLEDVALVSVEADREEITEGGAAVFTLSRMGGEVGEPLTVGVSVSTRVAEADVPPGSPGVAFGGFLDEVRFGSGATTARLLISSEGDEAWQTHTSLTAVVKFGTDYVVSPGASSAAVLVRDDDVPSMVVGFSSTRMVVSEGEGSLVVELTARTAGAERPHADVEIGGIRLSAMDGTALMPADYVSDPVSASLSPPSFTRVDAGTYEAVLSYVVGIVDDEVAELEEAFALALTGEGLAPPVSVDPGSAEVVITDDDEAVVSVEADVVEVIEGSTAVFTLRRDNDERDAALTVMLGVSTGTAEVEAPPGSPAVNFPDAFPDEVRFRAGETTTRLEILTTGDESWQAHTTVRVTVLPGPGYVVSPAMGSAMARVLDDDPLPSFSFFIPAASSVLVVDESVGNLELPPVIIRTRGSDQQRRPHGGIVFIAYRSISDTAILVRDYAPVFEEVSVDLAPAHFERVELGGGDYAWQSSVTGVAVSLVDDDLAEETESFIVALTLASNQNPLPVIDEARSTFTINILDDDHSPVITRAGPFTAPAGSTEVFGVLEAEDADGGDTLEWRKSGGADSPVFTLGEATGELSFNSDTYGLGDSADGDAEYELIVVVSDGHNQASTRVVVVVMADVALVPVVSVEADAVRIAEGSTAVFTLSRMGGDVDEPLTVGVSVSTQVAVVDVPPGSPGVAFGGFLDEVSFDSGATTARLLISSEADEAWQAHTSLTAVVKFGADYVVSPGASSAAVLVRDDDVPAMVVGFSGTGMMVEEGVGTLLVEAVARTAGDERPHADVGIGDIRLSAVAGTAMAAPPSDYVFDPVSVSLSPSSFTRVDAGAYELSLSFVVEIVDDEIAELEEEFVLTLTGEGLAPSVSIDPGSLAVVIADDDDPAVPIDAASTEVIEGSTIVFTLTRLDADLDEELTVGVSVSTRSVEAGVPGVGFGAFPDQVSFAPGAMTARLVITTVGDERWQSHVMLRVSVETGVGYGVSPGASSATVLVLDDDVPSMVVGFSSTRMMVSEGEGPLVVELTARTAGDERPHAGVGIGDIRLSAMDGTALAASDYVFDPVSVSLSPSSFTRVDVGAYELALRFVVEIVDDDVLELEEEFVLTLTGEGLAPAVAIEPGSAAVVIADDDEVVVSVEADVVEVVEGSTVVFTLRRDSNDLSEALTVMVGVSTETAEVEAPPGSPGVSFGGFPGEAIFNPGATTARLTISTTGDENWQAHTSLTVTVLLGAGYAPSETMSSAVVLVEDNDLPKGIIASLDKGNCHGCNPTVPRFFFDEDVGVARVYVRVTTPDDRRPHIPLSEVFLYSTQDTDDPADGILLPDGTVIRAGDRRLPRIGLATEGDDYKPVFTQASVAVEDFERVKSGNGYVWEALTLLAEITILDDKVAEDAESFIGTLERTMSDLYRSGVLALGNKDSDPVIFDDDHAPVITEAGPFRVPAGFTGVFGVLEAEDADGDPLEWRKSGGADSPVFTLDEATGELSFSSDTYGLRDSADDDENYELSVEVSDRYNQASTRVVVVVVTDVAFVSVEADAGRITEGSTAVFTLSRMGGEVGEPLTVGVSVSTQVAEVGVPPGSPGVNFVGFSGEVIFNSGETTARLLISSEADEAWQAHTSLTAVVEFGVDYVVSPIASSATVLVRDDDVPAMTVSFSSTRMEVSEGVGTLSVEVIARTEGDERPHADVEIGGIRLSAGDGTAMAPSDYVFDPVSVSLSPSSFTRVDAGVYELALSFVVEIVDDEVAELEEEFVLALTGEELAPAVAIEPGSAAVVIADDDEAVVSIEADVVEIVIEGSTAMFTLRRDNDERDAALTVMLDVSTETAEVNAPPGSPGVNFVGFPGEVSFDSGATTARLTILTTGDEIWQAHTSLTVTVLPGSGYAISATMSSAVVLVRDDDVPSMVVGFSGTGMTVEEGVGTLSVEVIARTAGDERPHADVEIGGIRLSAMDGTAMSPADYVADPVSVSLSPSSFTRVDAGAYELALSFVVEIVDDEIVELEEEFVLALTGEGLAPAVVIDSGSAMVVITDDDGPMVSVEAQALNVVRGGEVELGLSLDHEHFSASSVVLVATTGLNVSPRVVEFPAGVTRTTVLVSATLDAPLSIGEVSIGAISPLLKPGVSSRTSVTVLPRTVALRLSGDLRPLSSVEPVRLMVATTPMLVADETVEVSVSSSSPALVMPGPRVTLSAAMPTVEVVLTAGPVEEDVIVTLTATAVTENNVTVDAAATTEVVVSPPPEQVVLPPPLRVVMVKFEPSTVTLTSRRSMSVTVTSTLSEASTETLIIELVPQVDQVVLIPSTVLLTGANPSATVEVSLLVLPPGDGPVGTVLLQGTAFIENAVTDRVQVVPANSLLVEFRKGALRFRIRVFLEGALPL